MKRLTAIVASVGLTLVLASSAWGHVLDPAVDAATKTQGKLRADIAKQVAKYTSCLVKVAQKCEGKGVFSTSECGLTTGSVSYEPTPGKETQKFQDGIAKCDAKMDLSKKGSDYIGIGCPGDCNAAAGVQSCGTMAAYEASVESTTLASAVKVQLPTLGILVNNACGVDTGAMNQSLPARIDCVADFSKALGKYAAKVFKCQQKCELDFKDKKGNGGPANDGSCLVGSLEPNFVACEQKAFAKLNDPPLSTAKNNVLTVVRSVVNDATEGLFDRFDPTGGPASSPCGSCGNNSREGAEECDGTSDAACPGSCAATCECP